jgi:hypothetical protein
MPNSCFMKLKNTPQFKSRVLNLCAVVAISITLPALAYAGHDNDKSSDRGNDGRGDNDQRHGDPHVSAVPEANAGWVLIPFLGAVLLFSTRNLFREKVVE